MLVAAPGIRFASMKGGGAARQKVKGKNPKHKSIEERDQAGRRHFVLGSPNTVRENLAELSGIWAGFNTSLTKDS